ncbi:MAG: septum formation initiator family protein [Planctomycetota bacterium]
MSTLRTASSRPAPETISGMVVSLLFWVSLLSAAFLFGAVSLSPKILETMRLQDDYDGTQFRLVQVEQQNEQLQRVVDAIRQDPDFATEMTRIEFDAVRQGEEIIPVDAELRLSPRDLTQMRTPAIVPRAWYRPLLVPFAENDSLRMSLLGTAAVLILVSFTWMQPSTARQLARPVGACQSFMQTVRARYLRSGGVKAPGQRG